MAGLKIFAFADEASSSIDGQIAALKRNFLAGIEIRNTDYGNISDISYDKAEEIYKKLSSEGFSVWSIGSPIGKINIETEDFQAHIEKYKRTLDIAHILKCKNIRAFSFYIPCGREPLEYRNEVIDRLGIMAEISENEDITFCHENEKGIYGDTAGRCEEIYRALPDVKGIFDPANFIQCNQNIKEAWALLKDYIKYLHIKDAAEDKRIVPAGEGIGEIEYIIKEYAKMGGNAVTLEPHLAIFDGLDKLEQSENKSELNMKYVYESNDEAFDAAAYALKRIIGGI